MAEEYTCIECENLYDDSDGDTDERMCHECLDRIYVERLKDWNDEKETKKLKLYEQISSETYSCGICSREVKKGEFHHDHDHYINGRTWGFEALLKQMPSREQKVKYLKENPTTKKERAEEGKMK